MFDPSITYATAENGHWPGGGPDRAIDGIRDGKVFSSKSGKFPWLSLEIGLKPCRVVCYDINNYIGSYVFPFFKGIWSDNG